MFYWKIALILSLLLYTDNRLKLKCVYPGTGGVSMFALLLLVDTGIKAVIASSSDAKTAQKEKLSHLVTGVNYTTHPDKYQCQSQARNQPQGSRLGCPQRRA